MKKLKIAAMGVEHRHIFGQLEGMLNLDCEFVGWWTKNDNRISKDLEKKFPYIKREKDKNALLNNNEIDLILIADIPAKRADLAIECMNAGKDVMLDKPGCISLEQLQKIKNTIDKTSLNINFKLNEKLATKTMYKLYLSQKKYNLAKTILEMMKNKNKNIDFVSKEMKTVVQLINEEQK